jgi:hypothetical protein
VCTGCGPIPVELNPGVLVIEIYSDPFICNEGLLYFDVREIELKDWKALRLIIDEDMRGSSCRGGDKGIIGAACDAGGDELELSVIGGQVEQVLMMTGLYGGGAMAALLRQRVCRFYVRYCITARKKKLW